ncbi:GUN4 domain-containing protein [Oscillatoria sp. FACHB-1406]|uniref:GUN4 domain-containing protein n=1 Tax=Oscillatoria sp. FACHB-1406 TaxID=2692846 RepID=UPI001682F57C|nr:GUN4 domain-containing protein [Oscillatoria sp. FACHB-1406]MBD2578250.1 GUN4 domain-containing protein [Oscillatoria sp. FACHB-1406]
MEQNTDPLDAVELKSEKGADYTPLRDLLKTQQSKDADKETMIVMLEIAGRRRQVWLDTESIDTFPCADCVLHPIVY